VYVGGVALRVLSWNLFHGRAVPGAGRDLLEAYAETLTGWEWDAALLQEVPPWWPDPLAEAAGASPFAVLTSRNAGLALRRAVALRWPDVIRSNGGGANAILLRGGLRGVEQRSALLRRFPERRRLHAVRLSNGAWLGNLHAQGSAEEARRAGTLLSGWAGADAPAVLGGDFNRPDPDVTGFSVAARSGVDLVLARGWRGESDAVLERGRLSDHVPVAVTLVPTPAR
jgi:endonuclease/exonuclease/phosphatase family metal-dependent hydrolase